MIFGSVCSGIEAASVAWHPLGWRAAWLAEIEPFPAAVLAHHYPDVPNLGDMTAIAAAVLARAVVAPDVLVGGTPCQAFSVAGSREGLADARGQLTLSYVQLFNAIDHVRTAAGKPPAVAVWENVPGVLSDRTNAFGCFLAGLAGESDPLVAPGGKWANAGCVYGPARTVAWRILDAQYFGLAQRRRRVFVVASARKDVDPIDVLFEFEGVRRDSAPRRDAQTHVAALTAHGVGTCGADDNQAQAGHLIASTGDVSHCLNAGGMGRLDYETETLITQSAYAFQPRIARNGRGDMGELVNALTAQAGETGKGDAAPCVAIAFPANMSGTQYASTENLSPVLCAENPTAVCVTGEVTHTLRADGFDASEDGTGRGHPIVAAAFDMRQFLSPVNRSTVADGAPSPTLSARSDMHALEGAAVRRLTPTECERLQGFPDRYTLIPWRDYQKVQRSAAKAGASFEAELRKRGRELRDRDAWPNFDCPDGPRYKSLGNSMAVPVMRWIGSRIDAAHRNTIHLPDPCLSVDLSPEQIEDLRNVWARMAPLSLTVGD